jgi:AcrR family transcriptional regulator
MSGRVHRASTQKIGRCPIFLITYVRAVTIALETSKGLQRREQILSVARKLLIEEGYNRFVLREIAAQSGITIGNLQYYFRTRELLLEAVTRSGMRNRGGVEQH